MNINIVNSNLNTFNTYSKDTNYFENKLPFKQSENNSDEAKQKNKTINIIGWTAAIVLASILGITHYTYSKNLKTLLSKFNESNQNELKNILQEYHYDDRAGIVKRLLKQEAFEQTKIENMKNLVYKTAKNISVKPKSEETFSDKFNRFLDDLF